MNLLPGSRQNRMRGLVLSVVIGATFSVSVRAMDEFSEQLTAGDSPAEPVIVSVEDLGELFQLGYQYPQVWTWQPAQYEPVTVLWFRPANSGGLPKGLEPLADCLTELVGGVPAWPLWLTLFPQSHEVVLRYPYSDAEMTRFALPKDFDAWSVYEQTLSQEAILCGQSPAPWEKFLVEHPDFGPVPQIVIHAHLANINDAPAYYANVAAEAEELAAGLELMEAGGAAFANSFSEVVSNSESSGGAAMMTLLSSLPCSAAIPVTLITQTINGNVRIEWESETNAVYAVRYTDALATFSDVPPLFQLWLPAEDNIASQGAATGWEDAGSGSRLPPSDTNVVSRFYRILKQDGNFGMPCVRIHSPTNDAVVSGIVNVEVVAADDSRISSITLVIDGNDFATITDGPMAFPVPTALFPNGIHTIYARVADNVGLPGLGGNPDSDVVANVSTSETVQVNFQNNIVMNSFELFQSQLPVQASLAYTSATWSVQIEYENGTVVRNFSGTTSNGVIDVTWDGTDNSAASVPAKTNYFVTVTASPVGQFAASSTPTDSVTKATYREAATSTAHTLLARQKLKPCCLPPSRFLWEGVSAQKLTNIRTTISLNDPDGTDNANEVYLGEIFVMQADADWDALLNNLADPDPREITAFYYNGHTIGDKMGYHEFTPYKGLDYAGVATRLDNLYYYNSEKGVWVAKFGTPYKFVFLDGCSSGTGPWPRAFGILKNQMNYNVVGAKNRAFLGWGEILLSNVFGNAHDTFTHRFWQRWTEVATRPLQVAIQLALNATPGVDGGKLTRFGHQDLTWEE